MQMVNTGGMIVCGTGSMIFGLLSAQTTPIDSLWLQGGALGLAACMVYFWRKDAKDREKNLSDIIDKHRRDMETQHRNHLTDTRTLLGENIEAMKQVADVIRKCKREDPQDRVRT